MKSVTEGREGGGESAAPPEVRVEVLYLNFRPGPTTAQPNVGQFKILASGG